MSGTNHNMNGIRIETRVLAPPGGFSNISFGEAKPTGDVYRGHDFNPKNKRRTSQDAAPVAKPPLSNKNSAANRRAIGEQATKQAQESLRANVRRAAAVREQSEKENKMRGYANRERRDSLDELIENPRKPTSGSSNGDGGRVIPGLEGYHGSRSSHNNDNNQNHYNSGCGSSNHRAISPIDTTAHGRSRGQYPSQINKGDYAEILRQQIATKKTLTDEDGFERQHHRGGGNSSSVAHRAYPQYEYQPHQEEQQRNHRRGQSSFDSSGSQNHHQQEMGGGAPVVSNRRSQYGSGGGHSSISLSWE